QQGGKQGQHHQEANQVLGGPWSIAYGNGAIVLGHIPGHILKILDHLPGQDQQKEEEGVHKDPGLEIPIVHEQYKKGGNGQGGRDQVAHKGNPFELVGIEPDPKNIGRKEQHRPKGDITGHKDRQKIEDEIGGQLKALGHQTVQHALGRLVDQILLGIVKVVDDIATCDDQGRGRDDQKEVQIENDLSQGYVRGKNIDGGQVLRSEEHT